MTDKDEDEGEFGKEGKLKGEGGGVLESEREAGERVGERRVSGMLKASKWSSGDFFNSKVVEEEY